MGGLTVFLFFVIFILIDVLLIMLKHLYVLKKRKKTASVCKKSLHTKHFTKKVFYKM